MPAVYQRRQFIENIGVSKADFAAITSMPGLIWGKTTKQTALPRSNPHKEGVSANQLSKFLAAIKNSGIEFHSMMLIRHGHVIAEGWWAPYAAPLKHTLYSASKSFTATAVGLAIEEGLLSLEDKVISFFPNSVPAEISANLASMQVKHLLTMCTGHAQDTMPAIIDAYDSNWVKTFLAQPVVFEPGSHFVYNTGAAYMLSAIVQQVTGNTLLQYLQPRLFKPLGIEGVDWEEDPTGINTGGWGLRLTTESLAKFGLLYLQNGQWKGRQILPKQWVEEATRAQTASRAPGLKVTARASDWEQGYGYQFWRCNNGAFRADGAFGQFCIALPEQDAVLAITAECFDMQAILNLVWGSLLPAFKNKPLPAAAIEKQLAANLQRLALNTAIALRGNNKAEQNIDGKIFTLDDNTLHCKTAAFSFTEGAVIFTLRGDKGTHSITCGTGNWIINKNNPVLQAPHLVTTKNKPAVTSRVAASAAWINAHTLVMAWRFIETIHSQTVTCTFTDNTVTIKLVNSISVGNTNVKQPGKILVGVSS
jgi:CubicO group peptidase (beta-lactamase class C family)